MVRNHEQNVQDVIAISPKLQTGIDINVKFSGPRQYEFTQETLIFDLLSCPLVHGWIVDASDVSRKAVEKHASYNGIGKVERSLHWLIDGFDWLMERNDYISRLLGSF